MNIKQASKRETAGISVELRSAMIQALAALWTRRQVAERLKVCPHTVARYTRRGWLPCVLINRRVVSYREEDVAAFIRQAMTGISGPSCAKKPAGEKPYSPSIPQSA